MEPIRDHLGNPPPPRVGRGRRLTPHPPKRDKLALTPCRPSGSSEAPAPPSRASKTNTLSLPPVTATPRVTFAFLQETRRNEVTVPPARVGRGRRRLSPYPFKVPDPVEISVAFARQTTTAPKTRRRKIHFAVAVPVDRHVYPDSDNESDASDVSSLLCADDAACCDETPAAPARVRALRARASRDSRDSAYYSGSSSRASVDDDERPIDPAAAACIAKAREAFARHKAWQEQQEQQPAAPAAPRPRAVVVYLPRMGTPETGLSARRGGTPAEVVAARKRRHRLLAWVRKAKGRQEAEAAKKNGSKPMTTATIPAPAPAPARALQPRVAPSPSPSPSPPRRPLENDTLRQHVNRRLGGGVLEHSWLGGRDSYDRYPRLQ